MQGGREACLEAVFQSQQSPDGDSRLRPSAYVFLVSILESLLAFEVMVYSFEVVGHVRCRG